MAASREPSNVSCIHEVKGDLFKCPDSASLAHCISADVAMGKGIAVLFKKKFGGVDELKKQGVSPGGVAVLRRGERYVYYLVTKEKYWNKPTYVTLEASLRATYYHCLEHGVDNLSMPRIGCGLDGLKWDKVSDIINQIFSDSNIQITVCSL